MGVLYYPASIDWEVTSFCNQNCIHCYNCWRSNEDKKTSFQFNLTVTEDWFLRIAKIIAKNKPVSVIITGGEPLSVFWKIERAIKYLLDAGIFVSINTNLTLIDDEIRQGQYVLGEGRGTEVYQIHKYSGNLRKYLPKKADCMVSYRYNSFRVGMVDCYWTSQFYQKPVGSCSILAKKTPGFMRAMVFRKRLNDIFKGGSNMVSDLFELETMDMYEAMQDGDCADPETGSENCGCEDF